MQNIYKKLALVSTVSLFMLGLSSLCFSAGTTSAEFLKIGVGARASSMGSSFCALADDATAVYYNPAGLAQLKEDELYLMHNSWFQEINQEYLVLAFSRQNSSFAFSINYLSIGKIEKRSSATSKPEDTFTSSDAALTLSYAKAFSENLSIGINFKGIRQVIHNFEATGYAIDFGLLYTFPRINLALVIQNIGTEVKFKEKAFPLPLTYKVGIAIKVLQNTILTLEGKKGKDTDISYHLGIESRFFNLLALRAGYNSKIAQTELGEFSSLSKGLCAGLGLKINNLQLDYAYVPYGELGDTHRISLGIKF